MMKTFVFCSFKGGTAKTSTVLHLGSALAKYHNRKVLLVDFDAQANLSTGLGIGPDSLDTMVPVLKEEKEIQEVIQPTSIDNLHIIPANTYLDGIETHVPLVSDLYAHEKLRNKLTNLNYDYCFIDTPPSLQWLTRSAFYASQFSIICSIPEPYSILALNRLKSFHELEIGAHHDIVCAGVVLSLWNSRLTTNEAFVEAVNDAFPGCMFNTKVRRDISVSRAIFEGKSVFEVDEKSRAAQDFQDLANDFIARMESKDILETLMKTSKERV